MNKYSWFNLPSRVWTLEQNSGEETDLSDYYTIEETDGAISDAITALDLAALTNRIETLENTVISLQNQIDDLQDPEV